MDGTIIGQGSFLSIAPSANFNPGNASKGAGLANVIQIPSNADWVSVYNYKQAGTNGSNTFYFNGAANALIGVEFYWQRGMAPGTGIVKYKANGSAALSEDTLVSGGFTLYDPSGQSLGAQPLLGPAVATTATTNATQPVVSTGNTAGLYIGSVVRLSNTAQTDVNGVDMVVSAITTNTSFTLLYAGNALATAPGAIGGAGFYRIVNYPQLFYPRNRVITNITQATNAQVSTAIYHGMTPGQEIRFNIPVQSGMTNLNPQISNNYFPTGSSQAAIVQTVIDDFNFTINIDTSAYTAFTYPTISQEPCNLPQFNPVGEDTATSLSSPTIQVPMAFGQQIFNTNTGILADSTVNTGFLGMILGSGGNGNALSAAIVGPSGSVSFSAGNSVNGQDTMYWVAGKSTYGGL